MKRDQHHILLVDDDLAQQMFSRRALSKALSATRSTIYVAGGGHEAISYMIGEGEFSDRDRHPFPTIVITDLNMPDGDGFDVLEFMQCNQEWSVVPRILFSSSDDDSDVRTAYLLGASAYHIKAAGEALEKLMRQIIGYWTTCEVPPVDKCGRLLVTGSFSGPASRYEQPRGGEKMHRPRSTRAESPTSHGAHDPHAKRR